MSLRRPIRLLLAAALCVAFVSSLAVADEPADPLRPPAISTQDVPVVPRELLDRLLQYQDIRSADFEGWAPDGDGILVTTRFGNTSQAHRVFEPGGRREQVSFFAEPVEGRFVPEAAKLILLSSSQGGDENFQVFLLDREAYTTTLLTDGASRNVLGPVEHSGQRMIVASNRRNGRDTDLYVASTRQPDTMEMILETNGEFWTAHDWSLDGQRLLLNHYVSINESYPALFDLAGKKLTKLPIPGNGKASFGALAFAPDGKSAYVTTDAKSEYQQLARVNLETMEYEWLADDLQWDVSDVEVDPHSGRVAFVTNEDGASRLYLWEDGQRRELKLPLGIVGSLEFSPDGKRLGMSLARPDAPADAYAIDLATGELVRWTYSEVGGLDPERFVSPKQIRYESFDGREIPAYAFLPKTASAEKPAPVVIYIHGGPESQYRPLFTGLMQYLPIEQNIAVIAPNVRGSAGYGKTYLMMDNGAKREDSVRDIGALLDWIDKQPELDGSRVAVMGGSYGGYMVLSSLVTFGDRLKAGIDIVGIANFITFLERTSPYRQDLRRAEYGDERDAEMRAVFERINPTANAEKIRSALLVAHGENDPRVPFFEAQQIADIVRSQGKPVWTIYADNEGHGFAKRDNRDYLTAVEVMFLIEHLKN